MFASPFQLVRAFGRAPFAFAAAFFCLAAAISIDTAIATVLRSLAYPSYGISHPERVVRVGLADLRLGTPVPISPQLFFDWRQNANVFEGLAGQVAGGDIQLDLQWNDRERTVSAALVTANFFDVLGVSPIRGRLFGAADEIDSAASVAVISYPLWKTLFSAEANLASLSIRLNGRPYHVIGVLPPQFRLPSYVWLTRPLRLSSALNVGLLITPYLEVWGRLKPSYTPSAAASELLSLARRNANSAGESFKPLVLTMRQDQRRRAAGFSGFMAAACIAVLFMSCVSLGTLLLMNAVRHRRGIAIRYALGARRIDLFFKSLSEGLLLAIISGVICIPLVPVATKLMLRFAPAELAAQIPESSESSVLLTALLVAAITGVLAGVAPGWFAARSECLSILREESPSAAVSGKGVYGLLALQIACTTCLAILSGIILKSLVVILMEFPGFEPSHCLTFKTLFTGPRYSSQSRELAATEELVSRFQGLPGVTAAGSTTFFPVDDASYSVTVQAIDHANGPLQINSDLFAVAGNFFRAAGLLLVAGRAFDALDTAASAPVAIVDQTLAHAVFGAILPLHRRVRVEGVEREIIGVVPSFAYRGVDQTATQPQLYIPLSQSRMNFPFATFLIRTAGDPRLVSGAIRPVVTAIDKTLEVSDVQSVSDTVNSTLRPQYFALSLLGILAGAGLLFCVVGIYAAVSYSITQRRKEIGIRLALGASAPRIGADVALRPLIFIVLGISAGTGAALTGIHLIGSIVHGIRAGDPAVFVIVIAIQLVAGAAAALSPAWGMRFSSPAALMNSV